MTKVPTCPGCADKVDTADTRCADCGGRPGAADRPGSADHDGTTGHDRSGNAEQPGSADRDRLTSTGTDRPESADRPEGTDRDHVVLRTDRACGVSDIGLRHQRNEDAMAVRVLPSDSEHAPGAVCAVVCDGVSTSPRSDEASRVTAETGARVLAEQLGRGAGPRTATGTAMTRAAEAVAGIAHDQRPAPACTFVSAVVHPSAGTVTIGWVGDSRAYWVPDGAAGAGGGGAPALLTRDDSWAEAMVQAGALTEEEAARSVYAHTLVAWMGADSGVIDAHVSTLTPTGPGTVVLCSDGLWGYYAEPERMAGAVPDPGADPMAAARTYVDLALEAGGRDNVTVVVVPVPAPVTSPVPAQPDRAEAPLKPAEGL